MKPAPFTYARPESLADALRLLGELGEDAVVLAGGQSVVPFLNLRRIRPGVVVDIARIADLAGIREDAGGITIGATTSLTELERSPIVGAWLPIVQDAVAQVAHPAIRTRATVGGNLSYADPAAELPAVMTLLGAQLLLRSSRGERTVEAAEFFVDRFEPALETGELLTEIRLAKPAPGTGWGFAELARRHGDLPLVASCALVRVHDGAVADLRLVLSGVGDRPVLATVAAEAAGGRSPGGELWRSVADSATATLRPPDDVHATGAYRRQVAGVLARRVLEAAFERAA